MQQLILTSSHMLSSFEKVCHDGVGYFFTVKNYIPVCRSLSSTDVSRITKHQAFKTRRISFNPFFGFEIPTPKATVIASK
jgi:hypothetical protein